MNTFITLPSGLRVNAAHILEYRENAPGKTYIVQSVPYHRDDGSSAPQYFEEDMTADELDALLQPQGTPIVSPIPSEESISFDKPFQFTFEGNPKHGLIDGFGYNMIDGPYMRILSDGTHYNFLMPKGVTVKA